MTRRVVRDPEPNELELAFRDRLRLAIKENGISHTHLGELIGFSGSTVSYAVLNGRASLDFYHKAFQVLNVQVGFRYRR